MRATDRELRKRKHALPEEYKKVDTSVNGDAERLVEERKIIDRQRYPLRVDKRTVIYVTKDKCTPEYAEMKRREMNAVPPITQKGGITYAKVNVEEVRDLVKSGMRLKDIAKRLGVSKTTVDTYIKKYNLRGNKDD